MNLRTLVLSASVAAFANPVLADLTAEDVLLAQTKQMSLFGLLEVSVQGEERSGNRLSVASVSATVDIEDVPLTVSFGPLAFEELGDGSVAILYPEPLTARSTTVDSDGAPVVVTAQMELTDATHIATGDPERIRYAFAASEMRLSNVEIESEEAFDFSLDFIMSGISSVMEVAAGDTHYQSVDYTLDKMTALVEFGEPGTDSDGQFKIAVADTAVEYELEFTLATLMTSVAQALRDGNRLSMKMTTGEYIQDMRFESPYDAMVSTSRTEGSSAVIGIDKNGIRYDASSDGTRAELSGSNMPLPAIAYALDKADMRLVFPLLPSDDAQPVALGLSFLGLTMDDAIWNLFDPQMQLGRDPVDLVIDLEGTTRLTDDFLSIEKFEGMDEPPFADTSVRLNQLRFMAAGAELTGDGEITDTSAEGIPSGVGLLNFRLSGGNGLLDTLVAMGLLPEDQASGARMMMGLFARPGDGEDTLVSTIELQEDGSVLANGQRLK